MRPSRGNDGNPDAFEAQAWSSGGPLVVGLVPPADAAVIGSAAQMARELGRHIVFAYVERNSALIEQERPEVRIRMSLEPPVDDEMAAVGQRLREILSEATFLESVGWTLHILGGDPARAIDRLAQKLDARLIVVGGPRPGIAHRAESLLGASVGGWLARNQKRPVMVIPHCAGTPPSRSFAN